eukprot:Gb_00274 [translate_table: standard]
METSRSDAGASLPPRKRLLAGLKQNGWFSSAFSASSFGSDKFSENGNSVDFKKEDKEEKLVCTDYSCCVSCGVSGDSYGKQVFERVNSGRKLVSVCNSCSGLLNHGTICSYCFATISDVKDLSIALPCCKCRHRVHCDCVPKHSPTRFCPDPESFVCVDCSSFKQPRDAVNVRKGNSRGLGVELGLGSSDSENGFREKKEPGLESCNSENACREKKEPGLGSGNSENVCREKKEPGLGSCDSENGWSGKKELGFAGSCNSNFELCALSVSAADIVVSSVDKISDSSVHKHLGEKLLINREPCKAYTPCKPQIVDGLRERGSLGNFAIGSIGKNNPFLSGNSSLSAEQIVEAAKAAAVAAVEASAVAKATAFKKAAEAVKAAAVAKDALDLAALAVREEKESRAFPRKKNSTKHATKKLLDKQKKIESKEAEEEVAGVQSVVDDEELARQLHRAMNSSPRISRNTVSLGGRESQRLLDSDSSRAHSLRPGVPKQQTHLSSPFSRETKKQEPKLLKKSEKVKWGKLTQQRVPGRQSLCETVGAGSIDKLLQTLDNSEAESSVSLLALNQDPSVGKPIAESEMRDSCNGVVTTEMPFIHYDEKASDAGQALKELGVCNYFRAFARDGNDDPLESEVGNLEKLAETVAVVMEEENSRCEVKASIKEEEASCSTKPIEPAAEQHNLDSGDASSHKQAGFKRKRASLDPLRTDECRLRFSKCSSIPAQARNNHDHFAVETKDSPLTDESTMRSHSRRSNMRNNSERRTKSISGDFPQESQASVHAMSSWHKDIFKPSQSFAGSVNLASFRSAPSLPLQSPAFASGSSGQHS